MVSGVISRRRALSGARGTGVKPLPSGRSPLGRFRVATKRRTRAWLWIARQDEPPYEYA
jgi:hypothetical protein